MAFRKNVRIVPICDFVGFYPQLVILGLVSVMTLLGGASSLTLPLSKPRFRQLPGHFITRKVCTRPKGPDLHPLASFAHGCFSLWNLARL